MLDSFLNTSSNTGVGCIMALIGHTTRLNTVILGYPDLSFSRSTMQIDMRC